MAQSTTNRLADLGPTPASSPSSLRQSAQQALEADTPKPELPAVSRETPIPSGRESMRDEAREPARDYYRRMSVRNGPAYELGMKYHIDPRDFPPDCAVVWVPTRVGGMESGALREYLANGWTPARACDFPEKSKFGEKVPEALERAGRGNKVGPNDIVEIDDQILLVRHNELQQEAERERLAMARAQVETQMRRLEMASRLPSGRGKGNTEVRWGKQYVQVDEMDRDSY